MRRYDMVLSQSGFYGVCCVYNMCLCVLSLCVFSQYCVIILSEDRYKTFFRRRMNAHTYTHTYTKPLPCMVRWVILFPIHSLPRYDSSS